MDINKVSHASQYQAPKFIESDYPLFNKFIEYYYQSQEKTALGQNILNNFLDYLNIDKLDIGILDGATKIVEPLSDSNDTIVVESVDQFLKNNGSVLIGDEIIYYEKSVSSPNIALKSGISYEQVQLKWTTLVNNLPLFNGETRTFPLISQDNPVNPPTAQHIIVRLYGDVLVPGVDYTVSGSTITYTTAPRTATSDDDSISTSIQYLNGFVENTIIALDDLSNGFGEGKTEFAITFNGAKYEPNTCEYVIAIYDNRLLVPNVDFFIDKDLFIFNEAPLNGRFLSVFSIEAPIPSFGSGAVGYSRVDESGSITSVSVNENGGSYRFEYPPQVIIESDKGQGASIKSLVNGIKTVSLLDGGRGYSATNPPVVQIEQPTKEGAIAATLSATVTNGSVTGVTIDSSGSGYTFVPRVTFVQPGGAKLAPPTIVNGSVSGSIEITDRGFGYSTPPAVYIDEPTAVDGIKASFRTVITEGGVTSVEVLNPGQGYEVTPRIAIIDPVGAQVLEARVDGDGRLVGIDLLSGGSGYEDTPSVYVVDNRTNDVGTYIGGTNATAVASVFNGSITDINITNFGSGYSADNPPTIVIQSPPQARASVEIGLNEVTGFSVLKPGSGYDKAQFIGCARAASGIVKYTEEGNAVFSNNTAAAAHSVNSEVKCLDALFIKTLLDKYTEQYLPDVPKLDYSKIDVRTAIKSIKDFYSSKGTSFSIAYLFKLLYGEAVSVSYPKDQIIKPSAATWSIDTILRATLVSGDPQNIRDGLLIQEASIADPNIGDASALVENFLSIQTSEDVIYELALSEETINGSFVVPYKTKLAEPLNQTTSIITVDSTIGWPERNGEFIIGGNELVQYKEKSLNQFIECTRSVNGVVEDWDSATIVESNFQVYINKGTAQEVVLKIVGIVDAEQTTLTDTGSYYLSGDKLTVSKLGGTSESPNLTTWLYNVKKLVTVDNIQFGGINNQSATVTCENPHGLLVGDQVTVYGANPIIYNGTFLVTSRDSATVFQYKLPQPASIVPQGNILVSVDLNKGKSENQAVLNAVGPYTTNVQNSFFNDNYVYVASTGIPNYSIGPFLGSALLPGNQRKLNRFPLNPVTISTKNTINPGPIGTWVNGVSIWSYKSEITKTFGAVTEVDIVNPGIGYDAASPPSITISGGGGSGATASVVVDGGISEITVTDGGSGYTSSPLVSIVGGGGAGASATAIITKGVVSRILINEQGSGYTSQPSITIVGGGGQGASGIASVRGPIKEVNITNGGASYTSVPDVVLSSGTGAVAQAIVNDGRIISIAIISAGQGYTTAPEVTIQGDGFGAIARATIDVDGENAGRVTGIEIINRGIGYSQGTTVINLNSVGQDAVFSAKVFQWTYNLQETTDFDSAKGAVFEGYNNQYGGEYAHLSNPQRLRYILGDNLFVNSSDGAILEQEEQLEHSPIIGWAFDGNPIYGPYGYSDPTDQGSSVARLISSYRVKPNLVYDAVTNPYPSRIAGPLLTEEYAGKFVEDYEYVFNRGDLDQYNGRFCKTPEYPEGKYCYFVTIDASENGLPVFPYILGPSFNSVVDKINLTSNAIQQNIPTGVVRYRDPYENVDIDVERTPNASTNSLTTEDGDLLLFEIEDENRDGIIAQDEIDDPDGMLEESPLQLFDYFPKVKFDSKVDIEVETITKFEDASISGFVIENAGQNYQVNDRLIFDNTGTGGSGASARVSRIQGETISNYTFENISGNNFGVLTTQNPHNLIVGDSIFVDYTPVMDNTNKTFVVRQIRGIEEIVVSQTGSGYNTEIPPTITIEGDGESAELNAVVTAVGSIDTVNILNSGSGYTEDPRVILSHPQIFKKADYIVSLIENNEYVKVNDIFINEDKEIFVCGTTLDDSDINVGFISKLSSTGVKEWQKTLKLTTGQEYCEFQKLYVDGNDIWVVGVNRPNSALLSNYNPDIVLCKYVQASNGLSATLSFQKGYAGISGSTRSDNVNVIKKYSDTRYVIGGYTNTNSAYPYDAFIALIDTTGNFAIKRKLASENDSEKITDIVVKGNELFYTLETSDSQANNNINVSFGKATVGVNSITVNWIKEYTNTAYSFLNSSLTIDEYDEFYINATLRLKSDHTTKDSVWIGKVDTDGNYIWNYRYLATGKTVSAIGKSSIDIFGDLNIAINATDNTTGLKTVETLKLGYNGVIKNHTSNQFNKNRIEGIEARSISSDVSGDVYVFGQSLWNRNEFLFEFTDTDDSSDTIAHYTPTVVGNDATEALAIVGDGVAKLFARDIATPANWENAYIQIPAADLGTKLSGDWTIEFMLYNDSANTDTHSQTQQTLIAIGDATDATGGLWMFYNRTEAGPSGKLSLVVTNDSTPLNSFSSTTESVLSNMFADDTWQFIGLKKEGNNFTMYVNGISVASGQIADTALGNKDLYFGNIPGRDGTAGTWRSNEQGQYYIDNLRLKNRAITPTVPSDVSSLPTASQFALGITWTDTAWFDSYNNIYDYIDYVGWGLKSDKNADASRLGDKGLQSNTQVGFVRSAISPVTGSSLTVISTGFSLGQEGLQSLDFDDASTLMTEDVATLDCSSDIWSSRTATIPSPGSRKLQIQAKVKDRYFFKVTDTIKIDNVQILTLNQSFAFTEGTKLVLNNNGSFVNSGYITKIDNTNNKVYVAVNNNAWSDDLNIGELSTEQFNEQDTYGIVGKIPNDINVIKGYAFTEVNNTTPGTFDIDLNDYNLDGTESAGSGDLDSYAKFKPYNDDDYSVRIDEVSGSSSYIVGSVITINSGDISYNAGYTTATITNLTGVLKITLISNLEKVIQVTSVSNSDEVYIITATKNYLSEGDMIYVDGNPTQQIGQVVYDEYNGSFPVSSIISPLEFTYKLPQAAVTSPATSAGDVDVFIKSPVLKMYYGHQYLFDLSHSSMVGGNLSFSKDNLYKLEYSFNSIERVGTPGVTGGGEPTPTVKLKVDRNIVTNISYYFDPARTGDDSPVIPGSYLDVVDSPYTGTFEISGVAGATITRGADVLKFPLLNEPEGDATVSKASYSTSSVKAVGPISNIRIVNAGGFYTRLPVISSIQSTRQIERVQINEPGTEYAVGTYTGVPISGDGEGGLVSITVADGSDDEGNTIPGQIQNISVTSPGKGYTTATIDIDSVSGILGPTLSGSGADVEVVIPPFGTGASIFTVGDKVGKIKKLKNNNFGYDYPHDYTLRPEITFPINAQLTATSILDNITVTDPGSGYTQAPAVIITGGGGSGAVAEASIKNGRLDQIVVKDPGSGYSSTPTVSLRSSFNYVVNLDLGLLQFSFPHGIPNGAPISLNVVDTGDGAEFPIAAGAIGRLNANTTYFAITGSANSLEDDQLKIAITEANAELGDSLTFTNGGTGRQQVLTESFGGAATANVITSTFLEGELVYQGESYENATATGYVSTNNGWQVGPRIVKIVDYTGEFEEGQSVTGVISKSSGTISDLKIAKGVLEVDSITKTAGQFIDDVGKPSEIIQKIQDSYYYQDFSYAIKSAVSISEWKDILIKNVHPASFKVFGELNLNEYGFIPNKETFFQLTKSVELAQEATVPNIQSFALVEPVYSEFNNTEVLFRQKRLTSSENILTSVVQRLDDISNLFDGERIAFPVTIDGNTVVASANQLMVILNGVVQTPDQSFQIIGDSIVFAEPPAPPASVKYVNVEIEQIQVYKFTFDDNSISGIFPNVGNTLFGTASNSRLTVTNVIGNDIYGFIQEGNVGIVTALDNGSLVGGTGYTTASAVETTTDGAGLGLTVDITASGGVIVDVVIANPGVGYVPGDVITIPDGTNGTIEVLNTSGFVVGELTSVGATGFVATLESIEPVINLGLFSFNEQISNLEGDIAIVEEVNLETGGNTPIAKLRYTIGSGTTNFEVIDATAATDSPVPASIFTIGANYQIGPEIITVNSVTVGENSTTVNATRGVLSTTALSQQEDTPIYSTDIEITDKLALSKTVGTYQSKPGLFDIQLNDVIIGSQSNVVARITATSAYRDPVTNEFIEQVNISDGSSFFGLLFNRLTSATYPNVVLDDISKSQVNIVEYDDNETDFDSKFPSNEFINNFVIPHDGIVGTFQEDETIRNFKINYSNNVGEFAGTGEELSVRKVTFDDKQGSGFFQIGQVVRTQDTKAEVIGYNQARKTVYLGKIGRCLATGEDVHTATFLNSAALDTAQYKFGTSSLLCDDATDDGISIPTSTEFGFGTGAFTLEAWIRGDSYSAQHSIIDTRNTGNPTDVAGNLYVDASGQVRYAQGTTDVVTSGLSVLTANVWHHVAVSRTGTTIKLFIDGSEVGTATNSTNLGTTKQVIIGTDVSANGFSGWIDEVRISDSARYTATFSPRNGIHQGDLNAKLLIHFDGTDGQTYVDDWSGTEGFTNGEFFNNDAILATTRSNGSAVVTGFTGNSQRYLDAANLIEKNKEFLAKEGVYQLLAQYPSLVIPGGNVNCEDDIRDVLTQLIEDLRNGSNSHMWDASALYVDRTTVPISINHVDAELTETVWAYDNVKTMLQYIINNVPAPNYGFNSHGLIPVTDSTLTDSSYPSLTQLTPTNAIYNPANGYLTLEITGHGLSNGDLISIAPGSIQFKCESDNYERILSHPRPSDTRAYNQVLSVFNVTANEFLVNVGASPSDAQFNHAYESADANAITVHNYSIGNCADVYSTIGNLLDILTDTLEQANLPTPVDHLGTVTRVTPTVEYIGGTVDAFQEVPFDSTVHNGTDNCIYTNRIDESSRNRFYDAANLILANAAVIVDKTSYDLLNRYPSLESEMPRNEDGEGNGTLRCKTDLTLILNEIAKDISVGGNFNTVQAARFYLGANDELQHIRLQVFQSVYAHKRLGFYMKQAINGDLTYDNTDDIIVGDWGITNDPGGCANVQAAIDTLITVLNDTIAPTNTDYEIGADRLYFNRDYIAQEITGLTNQYLSYTIDGATYSAYTYDTATCQRDIKYLLAAMISDLQTGGTNSTIANMEFYLNSDGTLNHIEEELLPTIFAFEQIKTLGEKALRNLLYNQGVAVTGDQYAAQFTSRSAYRDSETPTDIDNVVWRLRDLVDIVVDGLAPGGSSLRNAVKNFYYNLRYYKEEIGARINSQFGSDSWVYDDFIDELANNIAHDTLTTDITANQTAYAVSMNEVSGDFIVGETVQSSLNGTPFGTAEVLEFDKYGQKLYVGEFTGVAWNTNFDLLGLESGATATITSNYGSVYFDGYQEALVINNNAAFQFGTGAFTIEAWVFRSSTATMQVSGSTNDNFNFFLNNTNIGFWGGNGSNFYIHNGLVDANGNSVEAYPGQWHHVAMVREDTTGNGTSFYFNGVKQGTGGYIGTNYTFLNMLIGANNLGYGVVAHGYISNFRVVSDVVYAADFALPTRPFVESDAANTVLLTCQGDPIEDASLNNLTILRYGDLYNRGGNNFSSPFGYVPGVSSAFDWYTEPSNVEVLKQARLTQSPIEGQISSTNLWTWPEQLYYNPYFGSWVSWIYNQASAPDGTLTAEKVYGYGTGTHFIYRGYNLTSYETFDNSFYPRFDSTLESFDTGYPGITEKQTYTLSAFFKKAEIDSLNFKFAMDSQTKNVNFNVNLTTGQIEESSVFVSPGIDLDDYGVVPVGNDWFRVYATASFGYGIANVYMDFGLYNRAYTYAIAPRGFYVWGIKLNNGGLDPYISVSGETFYANAEYNIKTYALNLLQEFMRDSLVNNLISPSTNAVISSFYQDPAGADALPNGVYNQNSVDRLLRNGLNIIRNQLANDTYYTDLIQINGVEFPSKTYGERDIPVGIGGGINPSDYFYGQLSDGKGEISSVNLNEGKIVKVYTRFRIDGDITDGPFTMNEVVTKQGAPSITGVVYGFSEDENFKYLDVEVTAGPWNITDVIVGAENSTTAQISNLEERIQIIDLKGEFIEDVPFLGYTSGATANPTTFLKSEASITDNTGGTLTVDTESLIGNFETTSVVYPDSSKQYIEVSQFAGLEVNVGDRIASDGYIRLEINIIDGLNDFRVGDRLYKISDGIQDANTYAVISEIDLDNNYLYVAQAFGSFAIGDFVGDYATASFPIGYASIATKVTFVGQASALVQDIRQVGLNRRLYLTDIAGTFNTKDSVKAADGYKAIVLDIVELKARVKRSFRGFDGTQTTFDLTISNGTSYLPDPAGHLLIFINGILQPPGASNAFTAFSNQIQFTEPPDIGSSFTGFYIGKLRQLDDISFEFDSLRQSFNLKRNEVFYSLTLTDGVQSSTIRPENNIIVSLNGVIQEPGIGFEIVGSRIIFSEIPRVGSTFVAFSYVGSEADVDAADVVPPIEVGDFIDIQGETEDREVAVIESSNSLITFDYLGSVFGQGALASANLTSGFIDKVQITSGGSGYTSRPTVRIDSISGFDGNIRAIVGVATVEINNPGSGYQNPEVVIETTVPDDWTPPNLADYGEELVDPEIIA